MVLALCFLLLTSCKKDEFESKEPATVAFPEQNSVTYGEQLLVKLPEGLEYTADMKVVFETDQTKDYTFSDGSTLREKLLKAAHFDAQQGAISIDSKLLYPTGASPIASGERLPEEFVWKIRLSNGSGQPDAIGYLHVTIEPARLLIKETQEQAGTAFAYLLYGEEETTFVLSATENVQQSANWYLPHTDFVSISAGKIVVDQAVSVGKGEEETIINTEPSLVKDGFVVAQTPFRMIFIPKIKYLFGQYYPDLDITIDYSTVHIGLTNGYLSAAPVFYPDKYKSSFRLKAVEKDGTQFDNSTEIFEVEESTGRVRVKPSDKLTVGSYKVSVEAVSSTGLVFLTTLTLGMS